jgi:hypothetical protein
MHGDGRDLRQRERLESLTRPYAPQFVGGVARFGSGVGGEHH